MRKFYTLKLMATVLLAAIPIVSTGAQTKDSGTPAIAIATNGAQNEGTLLTFTASTMSDGFYVDFGNGNTRDYPWSGSVVFSDRTYGDTIKVYANSADSPILTFSCKNDSLKAISLNCPDLLLLDITNNQIEKIDLSACPSLQKVIASKNKLYEFVFTAGAELNYLDVSRNTISTLNVGNSSKLEYLDASVNSLRAVSRMTLASNAPLKYLDLSCNNFSSLAIASFTSLETLHVNNNTRLKAVDLTPFTQLQALRAQYTGISSLDFAKCPLLKYVDVSGTSLTSVNVAANPKLETLRANLLALPSLDLSQNIQLKNLVVEKSGLATLDLSRNTALTHLDYQGNEIKTIDLSHNEALTYLDCTDNGIEVLDLSPLTLLDTLLCPVNDISTLDLSKNTMLKKLNCSSNTLSVLDISANKALTYLDCSDNTISALSLSKQLDIEGLSVKSNQFDKDALEALFTSLPDINGIEISDDDVLWKGVVSYSNNPGSDTADTTTLTGKGWKSGSAPGILGDASAVAVVSSDMVGTRYDLTIECAEDFQIDWGDGVKVNYPFKGSAYQNLESVLEGPTIKFYAPNATVLAMSNHSLTQLNVEGMKELRRLACSGNSISELDLTTNEKLEQLTCGSNPLTTLKLGDAKSLTQLNCTNTLIKDLDLSACAELQTLVLENNRLNTLNVTGCTKLETVDATFNNLKSIDLSNAPLLTTAYLGKNALEILDLSKSIDLQYLSVSYNKLQEFDASMLNSLLQFECNENKLKTLTVKSPTLSVFQAMKNGLTSLDIKECTGLTYVALNDNALTDVDMSDCTTLQQVWLDNNQLTEVKLPDAELPALSVFSIADNQVSSVNFAHMPKATEIVLTNNKFAGAIDLTACTSLAKLFATGNQLESIAFPETTTLTTVIVNDNEMKTLRIPSTMLYWLEADRNLLTAVDVSQSTNLMLFHADDNQLNSINFKNPDNLASVYLRNNLFEAEALNRIYDVLPDYSGTTIPSEYADWMDWIRVAGNPGSLSSNATIAEAKGWNVEVGTIDGINLVEDGSTLFSFDASTRRGSIGTDGLTPSVRLFTSAGASVPVEVCNGAFSLSHLPSGIYIMRVGNGDKTVTKKIVIR